MDFNEILNNILGADWLTNTFSIFCSAAVVFFSRAIAKIKTTVGSTTEDIQKTLKQYNQLMKENKELKEQLKLSSDAIKEVATIVSLGFMDSKSITSTTKLEMSKSIEELKKIGVEKIEKVSEVIKNEIPVEVVTQIADEIEKKAEESLSKAEVTKDNALSLYQTIISDE